MKVRGVNFRITQGEDPAVYLNPFGKIFLDLRDAHYTLTKDGMGTVSGSVGEVDLDQGERLKSLLARARGRLNGDDPTCIIDGEVECIGTDGDEGVSHGEEDDSSSARLFGPPRVRLRVDRIIFHC